MDEDCSPQLCAIIGSPGAHSPGDLGKFPYPDELQALVCKVSNGPLPDSENTALVQAPSC